MARTVDAEIAFLGRAGAHSRVLDLGCGPGWRRIFLTGRGFRVTAGDVAPDMLMSPAAMPSG